MDGVVMIDGRRETGPDSPDAYAFTSLSDGWGALTDRWVPHDERDQVVDFVHKWHDTTEVLIVKFVDWLGIVPSKFYDWLRDLAELLLWTSTLAGMSDAWCLEDGEALLIPIDASDEYYRYRCVADAK